MTISRRKTARSRRRAEIPDAKLGTVVVSSRIRLARNLADEPFPDWAPTGRLEDIYVKVAKAAVEAGDEIGITLSAYRLGEGAIVNFAGRLFEAHLISRDLMNRGVGAGYILARVGKKGADRARFAMMVNEEDHVRIQVFRSDYALDDAWKLADRFDTALSKRLPYAFSRKLGYLTACPSNLGTGMRASVMLSLPGLVACNEFESTCRAVDRLGFNARGVNGENTSISSCLVQISNRGTLGFSETDVIARLKKVVDEVIRVELQARRYSMTKGAVFLDDMVARSLSLLQSAYVLQAEEAFNALTAVRLGVELGMVRRLRLSDVADLEASCGPYAIRSELMGYGCTEEEMDDPDVRDECRAALVRKAVARATLHPISENLS